MFGPGRFIRRRRIPSFPPRIAVVLFGALLLPAAFCPIPCSAQGVKIVLKDGRTLVGKTAELAKVDEKAEEVGKTPVRLIVVLDDGLRFVYFPKYNIRRDQIPEPVTESVELFRTGLNYTRDGRQIDVLGEYETGIRFDAFGRRLVSIRHYGGVDFVSQAITEMRPRYLRVRAIHSNNTPIVWDMRLATNSLPREQLTPILMNQIDPRDLEDRIRLVRFYIQGNLYDDAVEELGGILNDWRDDPEVKRRLASVYRMVGQMRYQRRINELELRWKAGQYELVRRFLNELEKDEGLPEQLFMSVARMLQRYDDFEKKRTETIELLRALYARIPDEEKDDRIPPILDEIQAELSVHTIDRLASFQLYARDDQLSDSEKLAIGLTGWFAGSNVDNRRLAVAASFPGTRALIVEYLRSGNDVNRRKDIIRRLKEMESSRPEFVARILGYIKPPKESPPCDPERPGYGRFEVENPLDGPVPQINYVVQLPPEYDPNRRYPAIVSLNGLTQTPDMQLDWWSGPWRGTERLGQASRHGFIVIAPDWNPAKILAYDFSAFAHAAVLYSLKDAFRRFSVDTNRVFLSGHGIGGTAAWDIALAHPDLWAGAIPINAVASKYINEYRDNLQHVPFYFVGGELEGSGQTRHFLRNAPMFNRYLARQHKPYDVTVVRFIGRGLEGFYEEILNLFDWMKSRERRFTPLEFEANTMRPWDDFFWWVELGKLDRDAPEYVRDPLEWTNDRSKKIIRVRAKLIKTTNAVQVDVAPKLPNVLVYLTPEMIDFNTRTTIRVNGKAYQPAGGYVEPDIETILFDAKTRSDRQHPFWAVLNGKR